MGTKIKNRKPHTADKKTWASAWARVLTVFYDIKKIYDREFKEGNWASAGKQVIEELHTALEFDKRGVYLSALLLLASACAIGLFFGRNKVVSEKQELSIFLLFFITFLIRLFLFRLLRFRFDFSISFSYNSSFATTLACAYTDTVAFTIAVIVSSDFTSLSGCFLIFAFLFRVGLVLTLEIILEPHSRAFELFTRAQQFQQKEERKRHVYKETGHARRKCCDLLGKLEKQSNLTLGLAGRRGLGKTTLLHNMLQENVLHLPVHLNFDRELRDDIKLRIQRIRHLTLFVSTPTEFEEQVFLIALLERLAQAFNQALMRLLPTLKSFAAEQELREKRRQLRYCHAVMLVLFTLIIGFNFYLLNSTDRLPALARLFPQIDSLKTTPFFQPLTPQTRLYTEMRDSLLIELKTQAAPMQDSLVEINILLNPKVSENSWNLKGKYIGSQNDFLIRATWDSLKTSTTWPKLDSLRQIHQHYQAILDSIKAAALHYQSLADSLAFLSNRAFGYGTSPIEFSGWFWFNCILFFSIFPAFYFSREGVQLFAKRVYSEVRNEIALYERTHALLERLHFQMSFSEGQEAGLTFSRKGWQFARRFSKQVQRHVRPYTTMSLIAEYRDYIADAKLYLNDALKRDNRHTDERLKIIIAIDELDKILDTDKLHNMLKSMKPIFEIEDVCYLLSISEDALETYRLRHVDTKNEIDSAFTHIIPVPPMDAPGSLAFFLKNHRSADFQSAEDAGKMPALRGWSPQLLPAAIVFGGGVPRDMHRLTQVFGTYPNDISLKDCLERLAQEDGTACEDMVLLHAQLSDEGKQFWLKIVEYTGFTSKEKTAEYTGFTSKEKSAELLDKIAGHSLEEFMQMNPCSGDKAKEQYHRLRSLVRGIVVKSYAYHAVAQIETPLLLAEWPKESELESFIEALPENANLQSWFTQLEPLRDAIFELSRNPLRVWECLNGKTTA